MVGGRSANCVAVCICGCGHRCGLKLTRGTSGALLAHLSLLWAMIQGERTLSITNANDKSCRIDYAPK